MYAEVEGPQLRTLVVIMGQLRAGTATWQSMERHLLSPLRADLALLVHDPLVRREPERAAFLLGRANYTWWVEDRKRWDDTVTSLVGSPSWRDNVTLTSNLWGGVTDPHGKKIFGSGSISMSLRMILLQKLDALHGTHPQ